MRISILPKILTKNRLRSHRRGNEDPRIRLSPSRFIYQASSSYLCMDAYSSPSPSSSKISLSFSHAKRARSYTPPRSHPGARVVVPYQPSPSTSDLPIPSDDADIHVGVNHEGIQFRYAEMKRLSRKVLCSFFIFPFLVFFFGFECAVIIHYFVCFFFLV